MESKFVFMDPKELVGHERTGPFNIVLVLLGIVKRGAFTKPILVDSATKTILDGHHRRIAARIIGLRRVPCWCVEYLEDPSVTLSSRRAGVPVTKEEVLRRGREKKPFRKKTTKHGYEMPPVPPVPLRKLFEDESGEDKGWDDI